MTNQTQSSAETRYVMHRRPSDASLAGLVYDMCGYRETASGPFQQTQGASLVVPLVISFGDPFEIGLGHAPGANDRICSFLAGLFAGPVHIRSFGRSCCLQINFTPLGAYRCFGIPMHQFSNRMVLLDDLPELALSELAAELAQARDWPQRFALAETFVHKRLRAGRRASQAVAWAYGHILATGGQARVDGIAGTLEWSRKHLASRFKAEVGLTPKAVARIVRFNRAQTLATLGEHPNWADIAAACGYADQAHLAREFREFSGTTPRGRLG